ncbi:MAG: hypothetical protein NTZ21_06515 [Actinobacteria bacterium]|nr:hypothetical protein [Actinomycetota bacterium]
MELDLLEMGEHRLQPDVIRRWPLDVELPGQPRLPERRLAVAVCAVGVGSVLVHEAFPCDDVLLEREERQLRRVVEEVVDLLRHIHPHTRRTRQASEQEHLSRPDPADRQRVQHLRAGPAEPFEIAVCFRFAVGPPELGTPVPGEIAVTVRVVQLPHLELTKKPDVLREISTSARFDLAAAGQDLLVGDLGWIHDGIVDDRGHAHAPSPDTRNRVRFNGDTREPEGSRSRPGGTRND